MFKPYLFIALENSGFEGSGTATFEQKIQQLCGLLTTQSIGHVAGCCFGQLFVIEFNGVVDHAQYLPQAASDFDLVFQVPGGGRRARQSMRTNTKVRARYQSRL